MKDSSSTAAAASPSSTARTSKRECANATRWSRRSTTGCCRKSRPERGGGLPVLVCKRLDEAVDAAFTHRGSKGFAISDHQAHAGDGHVVDLPAGRGVRHVVVNGD